MLNNSTSHCTSQLCLIWSKSKTQRNYAYEVVFNLLRYRLKYFIPSQDIEEGHNF